MDRPTKITFADMRAQSVRGLLIYRADYRYSHSIAISGDGWPDDSTLSRASLRRMRIWPEYPKRQNSLAPVTAP
jgi:hypothetical protein